MIRTWVFLGVLGASVIACGDGSGSTDSTDGAGSSGSSGGSGGSGGSGSSGSSGGDSEGASGETPTTSGTGDDPFAQDPVCSRDQFWTMGNQESPHAIAEDPNKPRITHRRIIGRL